MAIVVGTDLSEQSLVALRAGLAIAQRRGDRELIVVHVIDEDTTEDASASLRDDLVAGRRARLDAHLAKIGAQPGITVRTDVLVGDIDDALLAYADTEGAELVVVTARGKGGKERLGGTTYKLALRSKRPLLVVRDAAPFIAWADGERPLRVLVGVDESAACQAAIHVVKELRKAGPVDIVVGHVYFPDEAAHRYGLRHVSMVEVTPELEQMLSRDLQRRLGDVPGEGGVLIAPRLGLGRIGDHMLEIADAQKVDLVLVGTRQKVGLRRLSSVSAVLLEDTRQSVLCVPLSADAALDEVPKVRIAVAATDRSPFSNLAIPWAYGLVGDRGEVHIVHVVEDVSDANDKAIVTELLELAPPARMGVTTRAHVVHGDDAARTIAETAERAGADVICICSHGRSGLSRALVGSVADKLMRACHRPVLVLRPIE